MDSIDVVYEDGFPRLLFEIAGVNVSVNKHRGWMIHAGEIKYYMQAQHHRTNLFCGWMTIETAKEKLKEFVASVPKVEKSIKPSVFCPWCALQFGKKHCTGRCMMLYWRK